MKEQNEPRRNEGETGGPLPPVGVAVWVQCEGYRTMAYRDAKGVWRNVGTGKEIKRILRVDWPENWPESE
jgi:hypothetical protein